MAEARGGGEPVPAVGLFMVLGAGASYGARDDVPRCAMPPLGADLAAYLSDWLDANDPSSWDHTTRMEAQDCSNSMIPLPCDFMENRARRKALIRWLEWAGRRTADGGAFETEAARLWAKTRHPGVAQMFAGLVERWLGVTARASGLQERLRAWRLRYDTLVSDLNRLITWALTTGVDGRFASRPDLYDGLLHEHESGGLAVVTVNYDVLVEEAALRHRPTPYGVWYPGLRCEQPSPATLPVYKLNGSCNWLTLPNVVVGSGSGAGPHGPGLTLGRELTLDTQQEVAIVGERRDLVYELKGSYGRCEPIMAIYTRGKPAPLNWAAIDNVRQACLDAIDANPDASATVIGVHVPSESDDPTLYCVLKKLARLRGRRVFVNPSRSEVRAASELGFEGKALTIRRYLRQLSMRRL